MKNYQILGQSNFAIAVLFDCLLEMYPQDEISVDVIANIPASENTSLEYSFETQGVGYQLIEHGSWMPKLDIPFLMGSIGRGKKAIFKFFFKENKIEPNQYATTIHPSAVVAKTAIWGHGIHIGPLSVLAPFSKLGNFVTINRSVSVGHHTVLGDFVSLNPGVHIAGCCHISEGVTIGAGATVVDRITIGEGSIIGAGSVVTRDVPAGVVAYGNPAKVIRMV
jgi:sugar O-acyltransferase (sialic acid O-acetyltransferase NeuD family)